MEDLEIPGDDQPLQLLVARMPAMRLVERTGSHRIGGK
jgi:hypothetical protein